MAQTNYEKVRDFNTVSGSLVNTRPQLTILKTHKALCKLRYDLIHEEVNELYDACTKQLKTPEINYIEVVDALADIMYVVLGAGSTFGIDLDTLIDKKLQYRELIHSHLHNNYDTTTIKYLTPYQRICRLYKLTHSASDPKGLLRMVEELLVVLKLLKTAMLTSCNFYEMTRLLCRLHKKTLKIGYHIDVNLDKAFKLVHESNMSKFCNTEDVAKDTVEWYNKNDDRYTSPTYKQSNVNWVVYNESTGKVLKSIKYHPVELKSVLSTYITATWNTELELSYIKKNEK